MDALISSRTLYFPPLPRLPSSSGIIDTRIYNCPFTILQPGDSARPPWLLTDGVHFLRISSCFGSRMYASFGFGNHLPFSSSGTVPVTFEVSFVLMRTLLLSASSRDSGSKSSSSELSMGSSSFWLSSKSSIDISYSANTSSIACLETPSFPPRLIASSISASLASITVLPALRASSINSLYEIRSLSSFSGCDSKFSFSNRLLPRYPFKSNLSFILLCILYVYDISLSLLKDIAIPLSFSCSEICLSSTGLYLTGKSTIMSDCLSSSSSLLKSILISFPSLYLTYAL